MKVLDLCCGNDHRFEGWFASAEDFAQQAERRLVSCPVCNDASIARLPSAPRLGRLPSQQQGAAPSERAPAGAGVAAVQAEWLQALRRVLHETEDVGTRFAAEARRIHHGEAEARGIRGQATKDEADALRDEGIPVASLVLPEALKGPVQLKSPTRAALAAAPALRRAQRAPNQRAWPAPEDSRVEPPRAERRILIPLRSPAPGSATRAGRARS